MLKSGSDKSIAACMDSIRSPISERGDAAAGVNSIDSEHGQGSRSGQRVHIIVLCGAGEHVAAQFLGVFAC